VDGNDLSSTLQCEQPSTLQWGEVVEAVDDTVLVDDTALRSEGFTSQNPFLKVKSAGMKRTPNPVRLINSHDHKTNQVAGGSFKPFRQTKTKTKRDGPLNYVGRIAGNCARLGKTGRESRSVSEQRAH
jgi:hypothetical protein